MEAAASAFGAADTPTPRKGSKAHLRWEVEQFSKVSAREGCLLNHRQAALLLDVSAARVSELVSLGKLTRYDFLGRTYVSHREIAARREIDVKAGRPSRTVAQRLAKTFRIVANFDANQWKHEIKESLEGREKP
jgi:hypothetical protein